MSNVENSGESHPRARLAAGIAAGVGGAAAAGALGLRVWRLHHNNSLDLESSDVSSAFTQNLAILEDERLRPEIRDLMVRSAALIYENTVSDGLGIITREELMQQLHSKRAITQTALSHLRDHDLISRMSHPAAPKRQGYFATPVIHWAIKNGQSIPLNQAISELVDREASGSSYSSAENPDPER